MRQVLSAESQGFEAAQRDFDAPKDAADAAKDAARKADETMLARGEVLKQKKLLLQTTLGNLKRYTNIFTAGVVIN